MKVFEEEKILESLPTRTAVLDRWADVFSALPHVGEFRRCGMVAAVDLVESKEGKTPFAWQERRGWAVFRKALAKGALLRPLGNVVYFMPPLTISSQELERLLEIAFDSIVEVFEG